MKQKNMVICHLCKLCTFILRTVTKVFSCAHLVRSRTWAKHVGTNTSVYQLGLVPSLKVSVTISIGVRFIMFSFLSGHI